MKWKGFTGARHLLDWCIFMLLIIDIQLQGADKVSMGVVDKVSMGAAYFA